MGWEDVPFQICRKVNRFFRQVCHKGKNVFISSDGGIFLSMVFLFRHISLCDTHRSLWFRPRLVLFRVVINMDWLGKTRSTRLVSLGHLDFYFLGYIRDTARISRKNAFENACFYAFQFFQKREEGLDRRDIYLFAPSHKHITPQCSENIDHRIVKTFGNCPKEEMM